MPCVEFYLVKLPSSCQRFESDARRPTLKDTAQKCHFQNFGKMILGSEFQTLLLFGKHFDVKLGFLVFQILAKNPSLSEFISIMR